MRTVDHRFALGNSPAFPSAPDKKLFASVSSPIFACNTVTSTAGSAGACSEPNTSAALSSSFARHWLIRLEWTSNCCAKSASVFSPFTAANATFGLTQTKGGTKGRWGATTTTPSDQLRLLQVVFTDDSPLSADSRTYIQSLMGGVATDQDWGVTAADSRGDTHAFVKNGWLPRSTLGKRWIINSIGRIKGPTVDLRLAILSQKWSSQGQGIEVVEQAAALTRKHLAA